MSSRQIDTEVRRRLKAGEPLYHVDTKLINSLEPDLLIAQEHCEVCAVTPADVERAGCVVAGQVMALGAGNVQGIHDGIFAIGRALGREQEAANLVGAMKSRISAVHGAVKHRRAPTVVALEWTDPMFAMGNWGPELVEAANGRPLLGEKGEYSRAIDWQQVRDADPDWLIVAPCGFDLERTTREAPMLEALPGWFDLRAVRHGQVVLADGNRYFNRSGTTIVETVEILAEILHGYPAGRQGKAWVRHSRLREWEAGQAAARAGLREQPAVVCRSRHGIRCFHGRFLEEPGLLLRQRLPPLPLPRRRQGGRDGVDDVANVGRSSEDRTCAGVPVDLRSTLLKRN